MSMLNSIYLQLPVHINYRHYKNLSPRVFETRTVTGSARKQFRDKWYKNLGDNMVLACEIFSSGQALLFTLSNIFSPSSPDYH